MDTERSTDRLEARRPVTYVDNDGDRLIKAYVGCPECRTEVIPQWQFCPYCGQRLEWRR